MLTIYRWFIRSSPDTFIKERRKEVDLEAPMSTEACATFCFTTSIPEVTGNTTVGTIQSHNFDSSDLLWASECKIIKVALLRLIYAPTYKLPNIQSGTRLTSAVGSFTISCLINCRAKHVSLYIPLIHSPFFYYYSLFVLFCFYLPKFHSVITEKKGENKSGSFIYNGLQAVR